MGVYIKGINYAECNKCPLNLMAISETCSLNKKKCPLVEVAEPHGRLVDVNTAYQDTMIYGEKFRKSVLKIIDNLDTVIESEG